MKLALGALMAAVGLLMAGYWLAGMAALCAAVTAYAVDLYRHPAIPCPKCKGSAPRAWHPLRSTIGTCPRCGGEGSKPRFGLRVMGGVRASARERQSRLRGRGERL